MEKNETCLFELVEDVRITWEITDGCNYKCKHCCTDAKEKAGNDLSTEDALRVIDEMDDVGVGAIYFSGGEPLTRKDLFQILSHASSKRSIRRLNLATNGSLITEENARNLASVGLESVLVSLDSHNAKVHNHFRRIDSAFDNSIRGVDILTKNGVNVRVGTVIWNGNIDYLEDIAKFAVGLGAYQVFFNWLVKIGRSVYNPEIIPTEDQYMDIAKKIGEIEEKYAGKIKVGYHRFKEIHPDFPDCLGGQKVYHITSEGYVGPCSWIVKSDPSFVTSMTLKEASLKELMRNPKIQKFKDMVQERSEVFGHGCPAMCISENGTYFSYDPLHYLEGKFVKR
ncbi:MAG: radical SAM protein [Nanoarchaeota archaeon]|nr:radical SAM protein [Nanoarchaeota archaeon]